MDLRKTAVLVVAAFHLLQATWLLQGGIDALFPRRSVVQAVDGCCLGTCGCPEKAQRRKTCCCFPEQAATAPAAAARTPITTLDEARCAGADAVAAALAQPPMLPPGRPAALIVLLSERLELPELRLHLLPRDRALDKVPLA
jgi:hypothetical protein